MIQFLNNEQFFSLYFGVFINFLFKVGMYGYIQTFSGVQCYIQDWIACMYDIYIFKVM